MVKISKKSWLSVAIGFFLIASISLWFAYSQHTSEQKHLKEDLASVYSRLNSIQFEPLADKQGELERQLVATMAQSEAARETLSQPMNSIISDILSRLFRTAEANSVNITEITSSVASRVALEGVPCLVLPITANIQGEINNLVAFITQLNNDCASSVVTSVNIDISYPDGVAKPSATIQMVIYTYKES
jgi:hypothetical protein